MLWKCFCKENFGKMLWTKPTDPKHQTLPRATHLVKNIKFCLEKNNFHHIKCWMDFKIYFEQNPLTNDFAILVNDQCGPYKVYKPSRDQLCNRTLFLQDLGTIALCMWIIVWMVECYLILCLFDCSKISKVWD